jgi:hypothetical protein
MLHCWPAPQDLIEQPPLVHAPRLQLARSPVQARSQLSQLLIAQVAPLHGTLQNPVPVQSTLQVAPGLQLV